MKETITMIANSLFCAKMCKQYKTTRGTKLSGHSVLKSF